MDKQKLRALLGLAVLSLIISFPCHAEIIEDSVGNKVKAKVLGFKNDEIQYRGEEYISASIKSIRSIRIDPKAVGAELVRQKAIVKRASQLIDYDEHIRKDIKERLAILLEKKNFYQIDETLDRFTATEKKFSNGEWYLSLAMKSFDEKLPSRDVIAHKNQIKKIESWIAARPNSHHAKIALMRLFRSLAWAERGSGFSNTVTKKGRKSFRAAILRGLRIGNKLSEQGVKSPALSVELILLGNAFGTEKFKLMESATAFMNETPDYYLIHQAITLALLPRWGAHRGLLEDFSSAVAVFTGTELDKINYLRIAEASLSYVGLDRYREFDFDWEVIKEGFTAYQERYQVLDKKFHLMAQLASLHGNKEDAKHYFSLTDGEWNSQAKKTWRSRKKLFESFSAWANESENPKLSEMILAAISEDMPLLADLIDKYQAGTIDVNTPDIFGNTMLHFLIDRGYSDFVEQWLRKKGVDINRIGEYQRTPLMLAVESNKLMLVKILLKFGADVRITRSSGLSVAHDAASRGFSGVLDTILSKNRSLATMKSNSGYTPLMLAAKKGHIETVNYLLSYPEVTYALGNEKKGYTSLLLAVYYGHNEIVKLLVDTGADLTIKLSSGHTALSLAKDRGYFPIAAFLESVNAPDASAITTDESWGKAKEIYDLARKFNTSESYPKAKALYLRSLRIYPKMSSNYVALAMGAMRFEKDYIQADKYIDKAIVLEPKDAENLYWKGRINYFMKKPKVYRPLFQRYVKLAPGTFNTKDLKESWSHLLVDEQISPKVIDSSNVTGLKGINTNLQDTLTEVNALLENNKTLLLLLLALLLLWFIVRRRA